MPWMTRGSTSSITLISRLKRLSRRPVGVVSNHLTYQKLVVNHDIPFHHIRVTPQTKPEAEARILAVVEETGAEFADQPHQSRLGGITAILRVVKHRLTTEKSPNIDAVEASYQTALRVPRLN